MAERSLTVAARDISRYRIGDRFRAIQEVRERRYLDPDAVGGCFLCRQLQAFADDTDGRKTVAFAGTGHVVSQDANSFEIASREGGGKSGEVRVPVAEVSRNQIVDSLLNPRGSCVARLRMVFNRLEERAPLNRLGEIRVEYGFLAGP